MTATRAPVGGLLRSEARKAATPVTYGLLAAILGMTALNTALSLSDPHTNLGAADAVRHALSAGRDFIVLFVALGAVGAAGEFRHGTAIPTFLATPVRHRVVWAKIATYLVLGLLVALAAAGLQFATVLPWAAAHCHGVAPWSTGVLSPVIANLAAGASYTALGVSIGLLVRNQLVAIAVAVGWFTVVESALAIFMPGSHGSCPAAPSRASTRPASTCCRSTWRCRCSPPMSPRSASSRSAPPCGATSPDPSAHPRVLRE